MSDLERARIREAWRLFCVAVTKVSDRSPEYVFYGAVAMALGWVLEEVVYRENFQSHIERLKSMGVEPNKE